MLDERHQFLALHLAVAFAAAHKKQGLFEAVVQAQQRFYTVIGQGTGQPGIQPQLCGHKLERLSDMPGLNVGHAISPVSAHYFTPNCRSARCDEQPDRQGVDEMLAAQLAQRLVRSGLMRLFR